MNLSKTYNFTQARTRYAPIEHLIKNLKSNNLQVMFANNKNLNLVKSSIANCDIKTIKSSILISDYSPNDIIFRPRAGWSPKNSLSIYWDTFRLYSQFDNGRTESYGSFDDKHMPHIPTILHLIHGIKERWSQI